MENAIMESLYKLMQLYIIQWVDSIDLVKCITKNKTIRKPVKTLTTMTNHFASSPGHFYRKTATKTWKPAEASNEHVQ